MARTDIPVFNQLKKGQGETNDRLEDVSGQLAQVVAELKRTNELLERVCSTMGETTKAP